MSEAGMDVSKRVFTFPAQIIRGATQEEWRQIAIERRAFSAEEIKKYSPYFWPATITNNTLDSHSTRMAVSSLRNYAAEAEEGVSFLYSHDNEEIVGHSMGGRFVGGQGNGVAHVDADFYAIPGMQLGTVSSDQVILGIDTKVLRYVSIGFYAGEWICSICGYDIWDFENCRHFPGYMFKVQADGETKEVLCTADVENAHLAEVSSVYKGSTPGAIITKAEHDARQGLLTPRLRAAIERRYHVTLPEKRTVVPGNTHEEEDMSQQRGQEQNPKPGAAGGATADPPAPGGGTTGGGERATNVVLSPDLVTASPGLARALLAEAEIAEVGDDLSRLRLLVSRAKDGAQYRTDLITEALKEGVRLHGATNFNQDTYKRTLEASDVETIKLMRDDWARQAKEKFPGGRLSSDDASPEPARAPQAAVPDSAFKAR